MGMSVMQSRRWTAEDVLAMPEHPGVRVEVIDGELSMTPAPSFRHQVLVGRIHVQLHEYLRTQRVGIVLLSSADITPNPHSLVQPDVFVIPVGAEQPLPKDWKEIRRLLLVVEVLSPYSRQKDRVNKRALYTREGWEYWIVDPAADLVERWVPGAHTPEICRLSATWMPPGATEALTVDLARLFDDES